MWIYMDFCTLLKGLDSWSVNGTSELERREIRKSVEDVCEIHTEVDTEGENLCISC